MNHKICVELIIRRNIIYGTIYIHCFTAHWVVKLCHRMECYVTRSVVKAKRQISATQEEIMQDLSLRRENTNARPGRPSVYLWQEERVINVRASVNALVPMTSGSILQPASGLHPPTSAAEGPPPGSHPGSKYRKLEACLGSLTQCLSRTKEYLYIKPRTGICIPPKAESPKQAVRAFISQ